MVAMLRSHRTKVTLIERRDFSFPEPFAHDDDRRVDHTRDHTRLRKKLELKEALRITRDVARYL